ncbi:MAG: 2Fe-2S iron-sulfur cluster-binding protein, partial [Chloroflexota bacterium]|nr:2Fe-2S iron-sulfur cluster-binding protein [Chloroflexota bacterium]
MPNLTIIYGEKTVTIEVPQGAILGEAITATGLPLEQPCAGRGTCGKCKVLVEMGVAPPDEVELEHLTPGELALDNRLACRAMIQSDAKVVLSPIVVYSNKNFRTSHRYKRAQVPLGLAIDLGSTTVAAFLTTMDNGQVCAGAASLNQQTVYGADVISRLAAARNNPVNHERLHRLALASINQAVDSLKLSDRV